MSTEPAGHGSGPADDPSMHPGYEVMDGSNPVRGQAKGSKKQKDFWLIRLGERLSGGGN